jgi:long-chain acyl-CoA synthetase
MTEASPVITVSKGSMRSALGQVGKPVPGVEVRIAGPDERGVGEILARGPNVMKGYVDDPRETSLALDEEGWLHTGDLGKLDGKGRLVIVGRNKDVIVGTSGENVYPDDVENLLAGVEGVKELCIVGVPDGAGGERVACLAVPAGGDGDDAQRTRAERHARATEGLRAAFEKLPRVARPTVVQLWDLELPRTATRKVRRPEVRAILEKLAAAADLPPDSAIGSVTAVRHAVATITNKDAKTLLPSTSLRGDLAIDSLLGLELAAALEAQVGRPIDGEALARCETIGDLEALVADGRSLTTRSDATAIELPAPDPIRFPEPVQDATKRVLTTGQMAFYGKVMKPRVSGRAFIPHNRNTIVVANHSSHLDMGFVKYALGSYGDGLVSLAAQDYFFRGNSIRRTYIENFTNLAPFDRKGGLRQGLRIAGEHLERGRTVLIFPEGTRSTDGAIQEFKPAAFHLALVHGVDILPVWIGGTYEAMKKGTRLPTKRDLVARIGPPLEIAELRRLTAGMKQSAAARKIAQITESAVKALRDGHVIDLRAIEGGADAPAPVAEHPVTRLMRELEQKFVPGRVEKPTTFYFTLGNESEAKFSMRLDPERCEIFPGKLDQADCVLKTSPEIFTRIVREAYVPSPLEFMTGAVKSNDVSLLLTFQKAFDLS